MARTVTIPIVGPYDKTDTLPWSAQETKNLRLVISKEARTPVEMVGTLGCKLFSAGSNTSRGMTLHNGVLYQVDGGSLESISSTGVRTIIGDILETDQVCFASNETQMLITTGGTAYVYTTVLTAITDTDFPAASTCGFINQYGVVEGDGGTFAFTDLNNFLSVDPVNVATAESAPDDTLAVFVDGQIVLIFGAETIEPWYNSGDGDPPFDRYGQSVIPIGIHAKHSIGYYQGSVFWLGDDKNVYKMQNLSWENVTTSSVQKELESFGDDAVGFCYPIGPDVFYQISSATADRTFTYQVGGAWFQQTIGAFDERYPINSYQFAYGKHLVGDHRNGNIYELDIDTHDLNGETILATRTCAPVTATALGAPGKRLFLSNLELVMETGTTPVNSGQGSDPKIMMEWSNDGANTFSTEIQGSLGKGGKYTRVRWPGSLGFADDHSGWVPKLKISDPVPRKFISMTVDVEVGN